MKQRQITTMMKMPLSSGTMVLRHAQIHVYLFMCTSDRRLCRIFHSSVSASCIEWWSRWIPALPTARGDSTCPETGHSTCSTGESRRSYARPRSSFGLFSVVPWIIEDEIHARGQSLAPAQPEALVSSRSAPPRGESGITSLADLQVNVVNRLVAVGNDAFSQDRSPWCKVGIGSPGSGTVNARFKLCGPRACTPKPNRGVLTRSQLTVLVNSTSILHSFATVRNSRIEIRSLIHTGIGEAAISLVTLPWKTTL